MKGREGERGDILAGREQVGKKRSVPYLGVKKRCVPRKSRNQSSRFVRVLQRKLRVRFQSFHFVKRRRQRGGCLD